MKLTKVFITLLILLSFLSMQGFIEAGTSPKTFKGIKQIKIKTMSSNCEVIKARKKNVVVQFHVPGEKDCFTPKIERLEGDILVISNNFMANKCDGEITWKIEAPDGIQIDFSSISGDFSLKDVDASISAKTVSGRLTVTDCKGKIKGKSISGDCTANNVSGDIFITSVSGDCEIVDGDGNIKVKSASGDIVANQVTGKMTLKVASGEIRCQKGNGEFVIKNASGDINVTDMILTNASVAKGASGDITINLKKSLKYNLTLSTASGDVTLDYSGNPIKGHFEFIVAKDNGSIVCPFAFDKEEEFEKWGKRFVKKSFSKGGKSPKISIKTASGKAILKK